MLKGTARQIIIVALTLGMLASNLLLEQGGGFTENASEGAVYFLYPTRFSPAPFTFLIWLPIFIGTVILAIYQALPRQRENARLDRMAIPYAIALTANALTPFVGLGASNLVVLVLFAALLAAYAALERGGSVPVKAVEAHTAPGSPPQDRSERLFTAMPIALFATWAGLATIVNACQRAVAMGATIQEGTATALIIAAMGLGAWAIIRTKEWVIAAVMLWAAIGLSASNTDAPMVLATLAITTTITLVIAWHQAARRTTVEKRLTRGQ